MNDLRDNPIQCPDDINDLSCYEWHLLDNDPINEPSDDALLCDVIKHSRFVSDNLPPVTSIEIKQAQKDQRDRWQQMWGNK
jgi:hypothetical protein